jgi:transposase-like protein
MASLRGERSMAELCREHDTSEPLLRRWGDVTLNAAASGSRTRRSGR